MHDPSSNDPGEARLAAARGLAAIGREFHGRGWSRATSSNYSVRLSSDPVRLLVTASGLHKDRLGDGDFVLLDDRGEHAEPSPHKSSAESMLHVVLVRDAAAGAVLHTHSVWGTVLSDHYGVQGSLPLAGYEMLKGLSGVTTHDTSVDVPIFPNTQDIPALAERVRERLADATLPPMQAFLIHKHGLYAWGATLDDARRHVEALEFLMECEGRRLSMPAP
ncbi:MAG: methylthioribulose 1-phosphate dehydratase, partial [Lacipirellulaceae bacterium]